MGPGSVRMRAWIWLGAAFALALVAQPARSGSWTLTRVTTDTVPDPKLEEPRCREDGRC